MPTLARCCMTAQSHPIVPQRNPPPLSTLHTHAVIRYLVGQSNMFRQLNNNCFKLAEYCAKTMAINIKPLCLGWGRGQDTTLYRTMTGNLHDAAFNAVNRHAAVALSTVFRVHVPAQGCLRNLVRARMETRLCMPRTTHGRTEGNCSRSKLLVELFSEGFRTT